MTLHIRPFRPQDQEAAQRLILAGLEERWGVLDPTKNPDLDDITKIYGDDVFLTAWLQNDETSEETTLVGTGALIREEETVARIVRMSVARSLRRQGIGRTLLEHLFAHARAAGYRRIVLETTSTWSDAIAFYERYGFRRIGEWDGDTHFTLDL
ncbi:MAG: GNAT family N-acetyltransferase [Anaerolineae bacterium]|nr:GNAT family N-acetyltransferase [Anaerolineae bacterium]